MTASRTLIVGIGSPHGDDQIGWYLASLLQKRLPERVQIRQAATPSQLLNWLAGVERLFVCDAYCAETGDRPTVTHRRWHWPAPEIGSIRSSSSHAVGLPQVLELAGRLGTLPGDVVIDGVTGIQYRALAALSPEVRAILPVVVEKIAQDVSRDSSESAGHA
jgi:hydrogenase maturation protease